MTGFFYEFLYTALLSVTASLYYTGVAGAEVPVWVPACAALVPTAILTLLIHMKARERAMLLGILAAGLAGAFMVRGRIAEHFSPEDYPWLVPVLLISVLSFAAGLLAARHMSVRIAVSVCAFVLLVLTLLSLIGAPAAGIFCAMSFILLSIVTDVSVKWKKEGNTDIRMYMVCTAPFLAVIMLGASMIHYPDKPYDWQLFINIWTRVVGVFDRISFNFDVGDDSITGFSDDGMLHASLTSDNREVLSVTTSTDVNAPIYIAGAVFDRFDGHGWSMTDDSELPMHTLDAAESLSAVRSLGLTQRDYYREVSFELEYTEAKTRYLFAPTKLTLMKPVSGSITAAEKGGSYSFDGYNTWHLQLSEAYLRPNADNPGFYEFMKGGSIPDEYSWTQAVRDLTFGQKDTAPSYKTYLDQIKHINDVYRESIRVSAQLKEKLGSLYDGAVSGYEKMKRLESALSVMEYSLDPPDIPASVNTASEYLDFFLLDGRKGYCSYYATAFVLLAREQGLPARYVQGFRVPTGRKGMYYVTSDMAHAWPEVYFEGRGWMAFDPTPGFYSESEWTMSTVPAQTGDTGAPARDVFESPDDEDEDESPEEEEEEKISAEFSVIAVPFLAVLLFVAAFVIISRSVMRARIGRMNGREKYALVSRDCLEILKLAGKGIGAGETLSEYALRVRKETGDEALSFIPCYETILYDDGGSVCSDTDTVYGCRSDLMRYLKKKSRFRYLFKVIKG